MTVDPSRPRQVRITCNGPTGVDCNVVDAITGKPFDDFRCSAFKVEADVNGAVHATLKGFCRELDITTGAYCIPKCCYAGCWMCRLMIFLKYRIARPLIRQFKKA